MYEIKTPKLYVNFQRTMESGFISDYVTDFSKMPEQQKRDVLAADGFYMTRKVNKRLTEAFCNQIVNGYPKKITPEYQHDGEDHKSFTGNSLYYRVHGEGVWIVSPKLEDYSDRYGEVYRGRKRRKRMTKTFTDYFVREFHSC